MSQQLTRCVTSQLNLPECFFFRSTLWKLSVKLFGVFIWKVTMSLLCFLAFIFLPVVKCYTEVQMALMVPNDTHRLFSVDIVLPAVNIGILRARSFLPSDVNFTVHYADSKCHIGVGINEAIKLWYAGKVHVFFGPVCDYAVAPVARQVGQRLTLIKGQVTGSLQCSISNVAIIFEAPPLFSHVSLWLSIQSSCFERTYQEFYLLKKT